MADISDLCLQLRRRNPIRYAPPAELVDERALSADGASLWELKARMHGERNTPELSGRADALVCHAFVWGRAYERSLAEEKSKSDG